MPIALFLLCDAALLVLGVVAVLLRRSSAATAVVYGGALVLSLALLSGALVHMVADASPAAIVLPVGLPWIGANFRLDALSAFFLVVINLGAAAASLYGIGYGRLHRVGSLGGHASRPPASGRRGARRRRHPRQRARPGTRTMGQQPRSMAHLRDDAGDEPADPRRSRPPARPGRTRDA